MPKLALMEAEGKKQKKEMTDEERRKIIHNPMFFDSDGIPIKNVNAEFGGTLGIFAIRKLLGFEFLNNCPQANDDEKYRSVYPYADMKNHGRSTWRFPDITEWYYNRQGRFISLEGFDELPSFAVNPEMDAHVTKVLVFKLDGVTLDEKNPVHKVLDWDLKFFDFLEIKRLQRDGLLTCGNTRAALGSYFLSET